MTDEAKPKPSPYRLVDDDARRLSRRLLRTARHAALAWLDPDSGAPMTSRVAVAADFDGSPILLLSQLSAHTQGLARDPRLSLLVGEPGAGDALDRPRLSMSGKASVMPAGEPDRERAAVRFVAHHPSAAHYGTFGDFAYFRVEIASGLLNAGFARAYRLAASDLADEAPREVMAAERRVVEHMNQDHADVLDHLMARAGRSETGWRIATLDRHGFELVHGSQIERVEFLQPVETAADFRSAFVALARSSAS